MGQKENTRQVVKESHCETFKERNPEKLQKLAWSHTLVSPHKILARSIIKHVSEAVELKLRKEKAGLRKRMGRVDEILALCNIIEQCTERLRQMCVNFEDFENACDRIHTASLSCTVCMSGVAQQILLRTKSFTGSFTCRVVDSDNSFGGKYRSITRLCDVTAPL